jgi:hypothetical protein
MVDVEVYTCRHKINIKRKENKMAMVETNSGLVIHERFDAGIPTFGLVAEAQDSYDMSDEEFHQRLQSKHVGHVASSELFLMPEAS